MQTPLCAHAPSDCPLEGERVPCFPRTVTLPHHELPPPPCPSFNGFLLPLSFLRQGHWATGGHSSRETSPVPGKTKQLQKRQPLGLGGRPDSPASSTTRTPEARTTESSSSVKKRGMVGSRADLEQPPCSQAARLRLETETTSLGSRIHRAHPAGLKVKAPLGGRQGRGEEKA